VYPIEETLFDEGYEPRYIAGRAQVPIRTEREVDVEYLDKEACSRSKLPQEEFQVHVPSVPTEEMKESVHPYLLHRPIQRGSSQIHTIHLRLLP